MREDEDRIDRQLVDKMTEPVPEMTRAQRRLMKRQKKTIVSIATAKGNGKHSIKSTEEVFDNDIDDIASLGKDLADFRGAQLHTKNLFTYYKIWRDCGVPESTIHRILVPGHDKTAAYSQLQIQADFNKYKQRRGMISEIARLLSRTVYKDEEEELLVKEMDKRGLTIDEMFVEILRSRGESIDLMQMQLDYLRDEKQKQQQAELEDKELRDMIARDELQKQKDLENIVTELPKPLDETVESNSAEPVVESYPLADWDISWTDRYWSDNPNHLHKIPSQDRQQIIDALEDFSRGNISISLGSVARALEFHLINRDVIQKALATRNKYAPEQIKKWVKVKRGKDRIGILIDDLDEKRAIFFVGGRDNVYRGLNG